MIQQSLIDKRVARLAEQEQEMSQLVGKVNAILERLAPESFFNQARLEADLVEEGEKQWTSQFLMVQRPSAILEDPSHHYVYDENILNEFSDKVLCQTDTKQGRVFIRDISPSTTYMADVMKPYLETRGIQVEWISKKEDWWEVRLTIEGLKTEQIEY